MNASASVRGVARHPVLAFMLISLGIGFAAAAIPPIVDSAILPLGRPLHGVFMSLGAGIAAFLVTAALSGRAGAADLGHRSLRWRVSVRWYLIALLSVPIGATLISLVTYGPQALVTPPVAGRELLPRLLQCSCCNWCCSNLPKRSDSPDSCRITGRTGTTP